MIEQVSSVLSFEACDECRDAVPGQPTPCWIGDHALDHVKRTKVIGLPTEASLSKVIRAYER